MKNIKLFFFTIIIFIIIFLGGIYSGIKINDKNLIEDNNKNLTENINKNLIEDNNKNLTEKEKKQKCEEISISGEYQGYGITIGEILAQYKELKSITFLEKKTKEYNNILNYSLLNCDNFLDNINKKQCIFLKEKDLNNLQKEYNEKIINEYDYFLLKSLIEKNNLCSEISKDDEVGDCNETYNNINFPENFKNKKMDSLFLTNINIYIDHYLKDKNKYFKDLKEIFINECNEKIQ